MTVYILKHFRFYTTPPTNPITTLLALAKDSFADATTVLGGYVHPFTMVFMFV